LTFPFLLQDPDGMLCSVSCFEKWRRIEEKIRIGGSGIAAEKYLKQCHYQQQHHYHPYQQKLNLF
jgi:hypothetical protein